MSDIAIRVENLSKRYQIGARQKRHDTLRDQIADGFNGLFSRNGPHDAEEKEIWALKDVSFEVKQGEVVGIIGRNGAGKSTLLKILSRITKPTSGRARIYGRVGSLLEVGTGFHGELSGRENIYLSGAILGMKRAEINRKFDEMVAFAEIEKFIDTPVKRYSSGMYVRLAFAVAAHLEPEILLVDEVLAVGDAAFQKKCLGKMGDVAKEGRTVLFVSHNMAAIQNLCAHSSLFDHGQLVASGNSSNIIAQYLETVATAGLLSISERKDRKGGGKLRFVDFSFSNATSAKQVAVCGAPTSFVIKYDGTPPLRNVSVSVGFYTLLGDGALYLNNDISGKVFDNLPAKGAIVCNFGKLPLLPGSYMVNLYCTVNGLLADWIANAARVDVVEGDYFGTGKLPPAGYGSVIVKPEWGLTDE